MLSIHCPAKEPGGENYSRDWHVGEPFPVPFERIEDIIWIQVDGHELEWIRSLFSNIPIAHGFRVVRWFGSHAQFICSAFLSDSKIKASRAKSKESRE